MKFGCTAAVSQKAGQDYLQAAEASPPPHIVRNVLVQRLLAAFSYGDKAF